jgi:hypothetical protein
MATSPWESAQLPPPPALKGWRLWVGLVGPGIVLAGTAIGSGEWLFGPAVTAHYGASLLWLASMSIILQVFCNLMMMRYTVYCGEPILVGGLRTWPGPALWIPCYLLLDIAAIWPYNASNAAVPLAAAILGRLPTPDDFLVKILGYVIFLLAFVPLIFGGTIYRTIEKIMTVKLFYVLGYLLLITVLLVPPAIWWEVTSGFFQFGQVPLRADSIVVGKHFDIVEYKGVFSYRLAGSVENGEVEIAEFSIDGPDGKESYKFGRDVPEKRTDQLKALIAQARNLAKPGHFYIRTRDGNVILTVEGVIESNQQWRDVRSGVVGGVRGKDYKARFDELVANHGMTNVNVISYVSENGELPPLDWATIAAFTAIAGLGGLANTLFSNYTRDKGWGMGAHVGAIPSAIGGRNLGVSHTGKVFPLDHANRTRWLGWMDHIRRDQLVWMVANFLGMALPCMLSLAFIRNAAVEGHRVAAMTADGMAAHHPDFRGLFWLLTLFCGFVILAPGQVSACDQIARRWTDMLWSGTRWAKKLPPEKIKYVYYGILGIYAMWGLLTLTLFNPMQVAIIGAVLGNVALGFSSLHALYVNRSLMPKELQPGRVLQIGVVCCGIFFLGISVVVLLTL